MADAKQIEFSKRLNRIGRQHRQLEAGFVTSLDHNGLVIAKPRRRVMAVPYKGLFMCVCIMMLFKAMLYTSLGAGVYNERVARLEAGSVVERAGGYVMKADPVTIWLGERMKKAMGQVI